MKYFWRIAITVVVLVALGFTSYFLFFKPDSDLETFTKLSDTIDKRDSLGIDSKLYELYKYDGHGSIEYKYHKVEIDDSENRDFLVDTKKGYYTGYKFINKNISYESTDKKYYEFDSTNYADIINYRNLLFYKGIPSGNLSNNYKVNVGGKKIYTYAAIEESIDSIFDYYFAYAQLMNDVKNSDQKAMNKTIKSYNKAMSEFNDQLKSVLNYQYSYTYSTSDEKVYSIVDGTETIDESSGKAYYIARECDKYEQNSNLSGKTELTSRYLELVKSYRNLLSKKCDMIEELKDMVIKYVFDGEFIIETSTVKMDLSLMTINSAISSEYVANDSESMLLNATHFIDIHMGVGNFANGSSADEVLEKYNRVVKNAKNDLKYVLSLSNTQLHGVASGDSQFKDIMSNLNQQYIADIQAILKAYGFGI